MSALEGSSSESNERKDTEHQNGTSHTGAKGEEKLRVRQSGARRFLSCEKSGEQPADGVEVEAVDRNDFVPRFLAANNLDGAARAVQALG